jgi:hypothetical protein
MYNLTLASKSELTYNEIFQSLSIKMSFVKKIEEGYKELFFPVQCREFFNDVLYAEEHKHEIKIYNFKYDGRIPLLDRDKTRLSLHFPSESILTLFVSNFHHLHEVERKNNLFLTECNTTQHKNVLIIEGDPWWMTSAWAISIYTMMLKYLGYSIEKMFHFKEQPVKSTEQSHLNEHRITPEQMLAVANQITKYKFNKFEDTPNAIDEDEFHYKLHAGGILHFLNKYRIIKGKTYEVPSL